MFFEPEFKAVAFLVCQRFHGDDRALVFVRDHSFDAQPWNSVQPKHGKGGRPQRRHQAEIAKQPGSNAHHLRRLLIVCIGKQSVSFGICLHLAQAHVGESPGDAVGRHAHRNAALLLQELEFPQQRGFTVNL